LINIKKDDEKFSALRKMRSKMPNEKNMDKENDAERIDYIKKLKRKLHEIDDKKAEKKKLNRIYKKL
jgi:hypothetical protein